MDKNFKHNFTPEEELELDQAFSSFVAAVLISKGDEITFEKYRQLHFRIPTEQQQQLKRLITKKSVDNEIAD